MLNFQQIYYRSPEYLEDSNIPIYILYYSNLLIIYIYTQDLTLPSVLYKLHLYSRSTFQKQLLYLIQQKHSHPLSTPLPQTHPTSLRYGSIVSESYH